MAEYYAEVEQRFGDTDAYQEYEKKTANYGADKWQQVNNGLNVVLAKFADCTQSGQTADSDNAQALVKEIQAYLNI